jgi:hypothetical protein
MKSFLSKNKKLLAISLIGFFIFSSGVAFAYTSQDWVTKATSWANTNCVNPTAATKQKAFFCYLWSKSDEQQTAIDSLNSANSTKTTQIGDLQNKAKNIWVYDQNNTKLGIFSQVYSSSSNKTTFTDPVATFYNTNINRFVSIQADGSTGDKITIGYADSSCSGQAYFIYQNNSVINEFSNRVLKRGTDYYVLPDHPAEPIQDVIKYIKNDGGCGQYIANGMPLNILTPDFPTQLSLPLIFKYE